jgi:hypothetical protein
MYLEKITNYTSIIFFGLRACLGLLHKLHCGALHKKIGVFGAPL